MIRRLLPFLAILYSVLMLCGCSEHEYNEEGLMSGTSLTILFKSADVRMDTRGIEDLDDNGTVSELEEVIDGRRIYRLAVFLVRDGAVVESVVLEDGDARMANGNTEATVSFTNLDYSKTYQLYAVANYGNYGTLTSNVPDVNPSNLTSGLKVNASSDNICPKNTVYPLTLKQEVKLNPGANTISGQLVRTYARLRINVRNQSAEYNLCITQFNLSSTFTQKSADLFSEGGTASVSPIVTSTGAITPFVQNKEIAKISDGGTVNDATIFDTYLLESDGGNYDYTLGLKYSRGIVDNVYIVNTTAINNHENIEDDAVYVIYHKNTGKYLCANGNRVGAGNSYITDGQLDHNYAWKFKKTGTNMYTIESMGANGCFMQSSKIDGNSIPLIVNANSSDYFTTSTSNKTIYFKSTSNRYGYPYYMAVNNTIVCGNTSGHGYYLYKVETTSGITGITGITKEIANIPINIVDRKTGEAQPIAAIQRNDFIEILVNVTYNEKTGNIEYEVSDWNKVNGEVTFD